MTQDQSDLLNRFSKISEKVKETLDGLSENELGLSRESGKWTIREITHHIFDSIDLSKIIIKAAIGNSGCTFDLEWYEPINKWSKTMKYSEQPLEPGFNLLKANLENLKHLLSSIPDAFDRYALIRRFNPNDPKISVKTLMILQIRHIDHHLNQIRETKKVHNLN